MEQAYHDKSEKIRSSARTKSLPAPLDSNMLFAFLVPSHYTSAFCNSPFIEYVKSSSSEEDPEPFHPSDFVNSMINGLVQNEDSPKSQIFSDQSHNVPEFTPIGNHFFNLNAQFTASDIYTKAFKMAKDQYGCLNTSMTPALSSQLHVMRFTRPGDE